MDIKCNKCNNGFKIPDNKIPPGKTATFLCPKCKAKIMVESAAPGESSTAEDVGFEESASDTFGVGDSAFNFTEEEGNSALVCEPDKTIRKKIIETLEKMDFHASTVKSIRDAIKKLRYTTYDIIILNEEFNTRDPDQNGLLVYFSRLEMSARRNVYIVMMTKRFRTMDLMTTFHKSVDLIVNFNNMDDFDKILLKALNDHDIFYRVFKESLKATGQI